MKCKNCQGFCIKKGCQNKRQKYYCKTCKLYQQKTYTYKICSIKEKETIIKLTKIGVGINGISNFTGISKSTIINKIKQISKQIIQPKIQEDQQEYEVDEMHTFIKRKLDHCYTYLCAE